MSSSPPPPALPAPPAPDSDDEYETIEERVFVGGFTSITPALGNSSGSSGDGDSSADGALASSTAPAPAPAPAPGPPPPPPPPPPANLPFIPPSATAVQLVLQRRQPPPDELEQDETYDETQARLSEFRNDILSLSSEERRGEFVNLIFESLDSLLVLSDYEEQYECQDHLLFFAENDDEDWCHIIEEMVRNLRPEDLLSECLICSLVNDFPTPAKGTVQKITERLLQIVEEPGAQQYFKRNAAVTWGVLAVKLAGQVSVNLLSDATLKKLEEFLSESDPATQMFAVIALEKFCETAINKERIMQTKIPERLVSLETALKEQVSEEKADPNKERQRLLFCITWTLDNMFLLPTRQMSGKLLDLSSINIMLNKRDSTNFLKISADGLQARNDTDSFESVRSTFGVTEGKWYYEVMILTNGIFQIGWATPSCAYEDENGVGIGDNMYSYAFDGCRRVLWHNGVFGNVEDITPWKSGDVIGLFLDLEQYRIWFHVNNVFVGEFDFLEEVVGGLYPAASFTTYQHAIFNFGHMPFKYPPDSSFKNLNSHATLSSTEKVSLSKIEQIRIEKTKLETLTEADLEAKCSICVDQPKAVSLSPCGHGGFCESCASLMSICPLCRTAVDSRVVTSTGAPLDSTPAEPAQ